MNEGETFHLYEPWKGRGRQSRWCSQGTLGGESRTVGRQHPKGTPHYVQGGGCCGRSKGSAEGREAYPPVVATTSRAEVGACNLPE
jgi:hypothetical protein